MKTLKITFVLLSILMLASCSSVKVTHTWTSDKISDFKDNKVLVIARTDDKAIRLAFENEIAKGLEAKGINAQPSYSVIPSLNPDAKSDQSATQQLENEIKQKGYNGVVISVVKDAKKTTQTTGDSDDFAGGYYGGMYPGYYGGFGGYYGNPLSYSTYGAYMPTTYSSTTSTYTTYVVETLAYDLDLPDASQMVAIVTSKVDEPNKLQKDAAEYTKKIMKALIAFTLCGTLLFTGCSSVKVVKSWSSDTIADFKDNTILVVARTDNDAARNALESKIAEKLEKQGMNAKASFMVFPEIEHNKKPDAEAIKKMEEIVRSKGYNGVLMSMVKDVQETSKTTKEGGYYEGGYYGSETMYPRYYGGFNDYYYYPQRYADDGYYVPVSFSTDSYNTYILETVFYDLDKPKDNQIVAAVTSELAEPDNLKKDVSDYTKKIMRVLK